MRTGDRGLRSERKAQSEIQNLDKNGPVIRYEANDGTSNAQSQGFRSAAAGARCNQPLPQPNYGCGLFKPTPFQTCVAGALPLRIAI